VAFVSPSEKEEEEEEEEEESLWRRRRRICRRSCYSYSIDTEEGL